MILNTGLSSGFGTDLVTGFGTSFYAGSAAPAVCYIDFILEKDAAVGACHNAPPAPQTELLVHFCNHNQGR